MSNALIVLAHGSRRRQSNEEVAALAAKLHDALQENYVRVTHAYLELLPPTLGDAAAELIAEGIAEITVYPFFLNTGNHVEQDVPALLDELRELHPDTTFRLLRHFGSSEEIVPLIVRHIGAQ